MTRRRRGPVPSFGSVTSRLRNGDGWGIGRSPRRRRVTRHGAAWDGTAVTGRRRTPLNPTAATSAGRRAPRRSSLLLVLLALLAPRWFPILEEVCDSDSA